MAFSDPISLDETNAKILAAQTKADSAFTSAGTAQSTANQALTSANGKNIVTFSTTIPDNVLNPGTRQGDLWYRRNGTDIIGMWVWNASTQSWDSRVIANAVIGTLDAGKITTGTLTGILIQAVTMIGSVIQTAASGARAALGVSANTGSGGVRADALRFYSGDASETSEAQIYQYIDGTGPTRRMVMDFLTTALGPASAPGGFGIISDTADGSSEGWLFIDRLILNRLEFTNVFGAGAQFNGVIRGFNFGTHNASVDASNNTTVTHSVGLAPNIVIPIQTNANFGLYPSVIVGGINNTTFQLKWHNVASGAVVAQGTSVACHWLAIAA